MLTNLKVFQKTYDLFLYVYPILKKFPKSERFTLVQKIENTVLDIMAGIVETIHEENKLNSLKHVSIELEKLKVLIRLSKELKFISISEYEALSSYMIEIGKMIGGWIKSEGRESTP